MSLLVKTTVAPLPRTDDTMKIAILYAAILVVMAVAQLFTFEEFLIYFQSLNLPLNDSLTYALAPILVISEVFAIPFLLRMSVSPAFRYLSMFLGWVVAALWLFISIWLVVSHSQAETVGFLGTVANLSPGPWAIFISIALGVLATWASWGLWPGKRVEK